MKLPAIVNPEYPFLLFSNVESVLKPEATVLLAARILEIDPFPKI